MVSCWACCCLFVGYAKHQPLRGAFANHHTPSTTWLGTYAFPPRYCTYTMGFSIMKPILGRASLLRTRAFQFGPSSPILLTRSLLTSPVLAKEKATADSKKPRIARKANAKAKPKAKKEPKAKPKPKPKPAMGKCNPAPHINFALTRHILGLSSLQEASERGHQNAALGLDELCCGVHGQEQGAHQVRVHIYARGECSMESHVPRGKRGSSTSELR